MKILRVFSIAICLVTASLGYSKHHKVKKDHTCVITSKKSKTLQTQLDHLVSQSEGYGGGIFRIASPKKVLWEGASGYIDASKKKRIGVHSTFEIASVTKTFTATLVLQLVEEKKLSLNARLESLLPASTISKLLVINHNDFSGKITVLQLLNHTSGLAHFWDDPPYVKKGYNTFFSKFARDENRIWHPKETLAYVPYMRPVGEPGTNFHYSDTNYVLLGMIIEAIEKKPLHQVFRKKILATLDMKDTYLSYKEKPRERHTESHRFFDDEDLHGKGQWSADWASGGLVSSTRDLEKFMFALASGRIFRFKNTIKLMHTWERTDDDLFYGLGIYGIQLDNSKGILWGHDGWGGAFMYYWPARRIVFTGTMNQTGSEEDDSENEWLDLVDEGIKVIDSCSRSSS